MPERPLVSIIIPMKNEEDYIVACLESVLAGDFPHERMEILVADGRSTDRSREIVREFGRKHPQVRLVDNPGGTAPAAMNVGIREARGEFIVRLDAHSLYDRRYVRRSVELLEETGAANVGGVWRLRGRTPLSRAIALVLGSRFGAGDSSYRHATRPCWVETVPYGAWRKETLLQVGGFDETWVVNQDFELNHRLRLQGGRIYLSPEIRCDYFVRASLTGLIRQYFRYGMWKVKTLVAHPGSLRARQLAAPVFVLALAGSAGMVWVGSPLGWLIPALYLAASLLAGASLSFSGAGNAALFPLLPLLFFLVHSSWGVGFWAGIVHFGAPRLGWRDWVSAFRPVDSFGSGRSSD